MGSGTIAGNTLTSITKVERTFKKIVAEHEIPGTASIMQAVGRKRDVVKVHGILNPSSEITAVQNIATVSGTGAAQTATAVTDASGTDWVALNSNTYFVEDVQIGTQPGATVPWGVYVITIREVA